MKKITNPNYQTTLTNMTMKKLVSNGAMKRTTMTTNPNFQLKKQNNPSYQFCLFSPTTLLSIISSGSVELELRKRK